MTEKVFIEQGMLDTDPSEPVKAAPLQFHSDHKVQHQQTVQIPYASGMRAGICDCGNLVGIDLLNHQKQVIGHGHFDLEQAKLFRNIFDAAIQQLEKELTKHGKLVDSVTAGMQSVQFLSPEQAAARFAGTEKP